MNDGGGVGEGDNRRVVDLVGGDVVDTDVDVERVVVERRRELERRQVEATLTLADDADSLLALHPPASDLIDGITTVKKYFFNRPLTPFPPTL